MTTMPLGQARNRFSEVVDEVERTHDRVTITRHGQPVAIIVSPADLESLEETLSLLATPGVLDATREGLAELENGKTESWDQLRQDFGRGEDVD
jgi:prevent-host-death family protein